MVRTRLISSGLSTGGSLSGSLRCQTSAARSWRRSVTRTRHRTPVMIRLRLQMLGWISIFANTGINDGLRLRRRVAPESTRSTHRVTSPFPGSLHRKIHHIHRPADFRDVYAGIGLDSRSYDAISDVFLALPPVPAELHALRLHLACSGRLF